MTNEINPGITSPAPEPTPSPTPSPAPSPDAERISQIETQVAALESLKADASGSQRRRYDATIRDLTLEKGGLLVKPVIQGEEPPAKETEPEPKAEQHDYSRENGYALEIPSHVPRSAVTEQTGQLVEEYSVLSKELRVPADAAQQLLETYADAALALPAGMVPGFKPNETTAVLRGIWGDQYEHNLKLVVDTTKALGPKFCAWLDRSNDADSRRLSDDPAMIQAILAYAKGWTRLTPPQAQAKLDKVMSDQKHPYWAGDKNAVAEVRALRARVSGTSGKGSATKTAVKAPAAPTGRQIVERRMAEIRANPDYTSDNKSRRQALFTEMSQLTQQLIGMGE